MSCPINHTWKDQDIENIQIYHTKTGMPYMIEIKLFGEYGCLVIDLHKEEIITIAKEFNLSIFESSSQLSYPDSDFSVFKKDSQL